MLLLAGPLCGAVRPMPYRPASLHRRAPSPRLWITKDPWFEQYPQIGEYIAQDGFPVRLPLRLIGHQAQVYGTADLGKVLEDMEAWGEDWMPATVGGKVPFQFGFNNFADTDCGRPETRNPYLETWTEFPVTRKSSPVSWEYKDDNDLVAIDGSSASGQAHRSLYV